jgi:hypothetical protein
MLAGHIAQFAKCHRCRQANGGVCLLAEKFISLMCHPTVTKIRYALSIMKWFPRKPWHEAVAQACAFTGPPSCPKNRRSFYCRTREPQNCGSIHIESACKIATMVCMSPHMRIGPDTNLGSVLGLRNLQGSSRNDIGSLIFLLSL